MLSRQARALGEPARRAVHQADRRRARQRHDSLLWQRGQEGDRLLLQIQALPAQGRPLLAQPAGVAGAQALVVAIAVALDVG